MPNDKVLSITLGQKMRDLRHGKGVKSAQSLSELMRGKYSFSAITRREAGSLKIDDEYLAAFASALKLTGDELDLLRTSAKINFLRPANRQIDSVMEWGNIALNSKVYHNYTPDILTYYLQSYDYARSIIRTHGVLPNPNKAARLRVDDAKKSLNDSSKSFKLLCHENVLYFAVGGPNIMIEQLESLLAFRDEPNVEFRILPRETFLSLIVNFGIEIIDSTYGICENRIDYSISDDPATVGRFQHDFDAMWDAAVIGTRREELLKKAIEYYREMKKSREK